MLWCAVMGTRAGCVMGTKPTGECTWCLWVFFRRQRRTHLDGEHLLAQFSLEFVLADFFEQSCVRERDPS